VEGKDIKVINLDVLISAMRVFKYEYSGYALQSKVRGVDFRSLDAKSIRTMNRLTRQVQIYQDQYQSKAK